METLESKTIGKMLTFDLDTYSVLINKSEIDDDKRLYFICSKDRLNDAFDRVDVYFAKDEGTTISVWKSKSGLLNPAGTKLKVDLVEII